jgi:hypothetical protein
VLWGLVQVELIPCLDRLRLDLSLTTSASALPSHAAPPQLPHPAT